MGGARVDLGTGTTVQDLADALAQAWSQDDNAIEAAAHYDQRQRDRNAGKQLQDQMYRICAEAE